jgi:hypothetical protein
MGGAQLGACVAAAPLSAQPLAVKQVGASEVPSGERSLKVLDGLPVEFFCLVIGEQRPGAGE